MNCKDCKHWGVSKYGGTFYLDDVKRCEKLEEFIDQDGEPFGGGAHLGVPPDFGCVLFEPNT
jgi:hypothetical protein